MASKQGIWIAATLALTLAGISYQPTAQAFTPANELSDLSPEHWAYRAIQALIEKYQVMEGYPDKTFRGDKNVTRYELAASLYKVLTRVEEIIAQAGTARQGTPSASIDKADLETIAALQKEFREELNGFKGRLNRLEQKMQELEKVRIGGGVEVRYRDRVAVTDSTLSSSPLFNSNPDKDQVNSPARNFISKSDRFPFRVRTHLDIDARLMPEVVYSGRLAADEAGFLGTTAGQRAVLIGGHFGEEGLMGSPVYVEKSYVNTRIPLGDALDAPIFNVKFGLYNFSEAINSGTALTNHFSSETWMGHGYGMVGWGGDDIPTVNQGARDSGEPYINSVSRFWIGDINASRVDPNSKKYNRAAAPGVSVDLKWGPLSLMVGGNNGSFYTNRLLATQGNLSGSGDVVRGGAFGSLINADALVGNLDRLKRIRSNRLDLPADLNDGYGVIGLELDLGHPIGNDAFPVRLGVHAMDYWNDAAFALSGTRKEVSTVIDLGTNTVGATFQLNSSFNGYDMGSLGLFFNNIAGSGIDLGLGGKVAMRSLTDLKAENFSAANAGGYVVLPDFGGSAPRVMLALRQSFGDTLGSETGFRLLKDSGITLKVPFVHIAGSNLDVILEYDALMEGGFFSGRFMAHDLALYSRYSF